jgi:hypothetical protein
LQNAAPGVFNACLETFPLLPKLRELPRSHLSALVLEIDHLLADPESGILSLGELALQVKLQRCLLDAL